MPAARVVPSLDVGEQRQPCLGLGLPALAVDQLALEAGEEALGHCGVVGVRPQSPSKGASDVHRFKEMFCINRLKAIHCDIGLDRYSYPTRHSIHGLSHPTRGPAESAPPIPAQAARARPGPAGAAPRHRPGPHGRDRSQARTGERRPARQAAVGARCWLGRARPRRQSAAPAAEPAPNPASSAPRPADRKKSGAVAGKARSTAPGLRIPAKKGSW